MAVLGAFHASKYSEIKLLLGSRRNPVRRLLKLPACWFLNQRFGSQQGDLNAPGGCAASWLTKKHKSRVLVFFTCVFLKKSSSSFLLSSLEFLFSFFPLSSSLHADLNASFAQRLSLFLAHSSAFFQCFPFSCTF